MSDIPFNCPSCKQSLEAPSEMVGQLIDCPSCNRPLEVPFPKRNTLQPKRQPPPEDKQLKNCPYCAEQILANAIKCKHCREFLDGRSKQHPSPQQPEKRSVGVASDGAFNLNDPVHVIGLIICGLIIYSVMWWCFGGGYTDYKHKMGKTVQDVHAQVQQEMRGIERDVAADAVKQYEIAKRSGSAIDAYVHAGLASAAYVQAKDEVNYQKWKEIERQDGIRAGMSPDILK